MKQWRTGRMIISKVQIIDKKSGSDTWEELNSMLKLNFHHICRLLWTLWIDYICEILFFHLCLKPRCRWPFDFLSMRLWNRFRYFENMVGGISPSRFSMSTSSFSHFMALVCTASWFNLNHARCLKEKSYRAYIIPKCLQLPNTILLIFFSGGLCMDGCSHFLRFPIG